LFLNSLPTLAWRPAGQGRASGPGETSEAARPAEPLRRRTSMRDRSPSTWLHLVCLEPVFFVLDAEARSNPCASAHLSSIESSQNSPFARSACGAFQIAVLEEGALRMCRPRTRVERRAAVCADIKRAQAIAKKGGRPEAALSLGRKRPRRAYANLIPHRNNVMLRRSSCKHVSFARSRARSINDRLAGRSGQSGAWLRITAKVLHM
jgi:hypothetical protein